MSESATIDYCIQIAPGFGVSLGTARDEIASAFATWFKYVDSVGVNRRRLPVYRIATRAHFMSSCDGTEDLAFLLGVNTASVAQAKNAYYNPTAFASRTSYDSKAGWGRGFIWLAPPAAVTQSFPDWTKSYELAGTLLHEIGHVLGNGHVPGTIMDAGISSRLQSPGNSDFSWTRKVDGYVALDVCEECDTRGFVSKDDGEAAKTFQLFTGRAVAGKVRAAVSFNKPPFQLTLTDDKGSVAVPMSTQDYEKSVSSIADLAIATFRVARNLEPTCSNGACLVNSGGAIQRHLEAGIIYATATLPTGRKKSITVELNMKNSIVESPITAWYRDGEKRVPLFYRSE